MGGTFEKMKGRNDRRVGITNETDEHSGIENGEPYDDQWWGHQNDYDSVEEKRAGSTRSRLTEEALEEERERRARDRRRRKRRARRTRKRSDMDSSPRGSNNDVGVYRSRTHSGDFSEHRDMSEEDDAFAREVGRINSQQHHGNYLRTSGRRQPSTHAQRGRNKIEGSTSLDIDDMDAFARKMLTPRPLSVEPSVNVEVDDSYFTHAERQEYEQSIPEAHLRPQGLGTGLNDGLRWRRGELLGSGAYGNVYLGLNLETGELMGAKQIGLKYTGYVEGGREYADHILALQTEIALMQGLKHINIGESPEYVPIV